MLTWSNIEKNIELMLLLPCRVYMYPHKEDCLLSLARISFKWDNEFINLGGESWELIDEKKTLMPTKLKAFLLALHHDHIRKVNNYTSFISSFSYFKIGTRWPWNSTGSIIFLKEIHWRFIRCKWAVFPKKEKMGWSLCDVRRTARKKHPTIMRSQLLSNVFTWNGVCQIWGSQIILTDIYW